MSVKLISITKPMIDGAESAEQLMAYCARVSNPANQANHQTADRLLRYCAKHGHWSVFEMADMCVEIRTTRAIAAQILRHRSFTFQEFSQRYSQVSEGIISTEARGQDTKNKQNSLENIPAEDKEWFTAAQAEVAAVAEQAYQEAIERGIAKECARMLLPLNTATTLYMKGSVRSWIHYLNVRLDPATQKEHREVAAGIQAILLEQFPTVKDVLKFPAE